MEKFLSIPVLDANGTNSQNQLVSVTGLRTIGQPTTTTATLNYLNGKVTTLTWPAAHAAPILLEAVQTAAVNALNSGWTQVVSQYDPIGMITGTPNTNPLTSIGIA